MAEVTIVLTDHETFDLNGQKVQRVAVQIHAAHNLSEDGPFTMAEASVIEIMEFLVSKDVEGPEAVRSRTRIREVGKPDVEI